MSGVVEIVLTDKEIDLIIAWAEDAGVTIYKNVQPPTVENYLLERFESYKHALACRPALCAPRDLDPNAP